jgi:hypothetical protein
MLTCTLRPVKEWDGAVWPGVSVVLVHRARSEGARLGKGRVSARSGWGVIMLRAFKGITARLFVGRVRGEVEEVTIGRLDKL